MNIPIDDKVTVLPVRKKQEGKAIELVQSNYGDCKHAHVLVDPQLSELTCRDCKQRLNPIQYIANVANGLNGWEYERSQILKARADHAERTRCRCTKCGEWTEIRRVRQDEVAQIKSTAKRGGE